MTTPATPPGDDRPESPEERDRRVSGGYTGGYLPGHDPFGPGNGFDHLKGTVNAVVVPPPPPGNNT